jgi:rare lipoprotein A
VIVRVNDRGPFHDGRIIDLSYAAAYKLDLLRGVAPVEIERITNDDIRTGAWRRDTGTMLASAAPAAAAQNRAIPTPVRPPTPQVQIPSGWTAQVASDASLDSPLPGARAGDAAAPAFVPLTASPAQTPATAQTALPADLPPPMPPPQEADAPRGNMIVTELAPLAPLPAQPAAARAPDLQPAQPAAAPLPAAPASGFWVQLGAFREREGAESLLAQAARGLPALAPQLHVFSEAGTHRLQAGPFASRGAAAEVVSQLRDSLRLAPMVVERR